MATFGAGCYWGTEKYFAKDFNAEFPGSILGTSVGFMHFTKSEEKSPSYDAVCSGMTGYVEVVHVLFDSSKCTFEDMCKFFFSFHDPTTKNQQGNDMGT